MKKLAILLVAVAMLAAFFCLPTSAVASAIGEVRVPYVTTAPTLDGVLSDGEWTGAKTTFSKDTATLALSTAASYDEANFTFSFDCYYAWDEDYLYVAWQMNGADMWFDYGGNYIRLYLDPAGQFLAFGEAQQNEASGAMFRSVAAVKSDGSGVFGLQQLGVANIEYAVGDGNCGLTTSENGWIYESRISWDDMATSVMTKTGNANATVLPEAGYTLRANYDCYHINQAGTYKGFLTTSMDQEIIATNVWNFSKYADILLVLEDENGGVGSYVPDTSESEEVTTAPDTEDTEDTEEDVTTPEATTPAASDSQKETDETSDTEETSTPAVDDEKGGNSLPIIIIAIVAVVVVAAVVVIAIKKRK